ncbi:MAG: SusC/RagA family TonB-linked outer membrane protein [Chitinophagaceae bacterium]
MRMTATLLLGICLHLSAETMSQQVTLSARNASLQTVFKKIKEQTGYSFVYRNDWLQEAASISIDVREANLWAVLDLCFKGQPFTWEAVRNTIVLRRRTPQAVIEAAAEAAPPIVKGKITDESGKPVAGASVVVKGTKRGSVTGNDGDFEFDAGNENVTLVISCIGYATREIKVKAGEPVKVALVAVNTNLQDMVVTGISTRRKESFTGASVSFNNNQLKSIGNQNVIQSLKSLDPSFIVAENNLQGANPNMIPDIEIRGKTSVVSNSLRSQFTTNPNLPLFILDGFETSLTTINDLDINRIESVTLLKDAASTAIYGARAANGVVVLETRKPKPGKMQVYYSGDYRLEIPDLSGYNMMNAAEKLEFERLSGRYRVVYPTQYEEQMYLDSLYQSRLYRVKKGVNTYWLNEPVRMGFTHANSIRAEGGDNTFSYGAGVQYKQVDGVMKGSSRKTWQGNIDLVYRKGKVNVNNKMMVNGVNAPESPYGSFSNFVNANPYYEKRNAYGGVDKYLEIAKKRTILYYDSVPNPLYNTGLNSYSHNNSFNFLDNLQLIYNISSSLSFTGGIQFSKSSSDGERYVAPENTEFDDVNIFKRGSYTNQRITGSAYQANAMFTYANIFNGIHQVSANVRAEAQESTDQFYSTEVVGFPPGSNGNPAFAYGYNPDDRPITGYNKYRRNNFLVSGSYMYNRRFVTDFSYRLDGSTAFGSSKKFRPFWSVGVAWNLHSEPMFENAHWINRLRLKANTGSTGNQNFGQVTSVSVYSYQQLINIFGQGTSLSTLGNPNLGWQNTQQTNFGIDFSLFNDKLSGFINVYQKYTNPLIVVLDLPSSTGLYNYPKNVGHMNNKGIEANIRYAPINDERHGLNWSIGVTGIFQKAVYGGLRTDLESLNKAQQESKQLLRFHDGYSPEDMWAVYSYGIDPASGREIFRTKDGKMTYDYSTNDIVKVGNERPVAEGVLTSTFLWKGFSLNLAFRYRFGGDVFNSALYNKVENISDKNIFYNQDKRALYDRWKKPGDISQFKSISITSTTPMSSRFIQEENTFTGESVRLGYDCSNRAFVKKMGMRSLSFSAYLNDIFRISSVKRERGIDYPFSRVISFSVNAAF